VHQNAIPICLKDAREHGWFSAAERLKGFQQPSTEHVNVMSPGAPAVILGRAVLKTRLDPFSCPNRGRLPYCNGRKQMAARATPAKQPFDGIRNSTFYNSYRV